MAGFFGLFNYAKEGPGVEKNAPKKRPFFAFMDVYGRKFWNLAVAGLLYSLVSVPVVTHGWAEAGLTRITRSYSREKHAFLKEDFFESIKKNRRDSLIIGIINLIVTAILIYNLVALIPVMIPGLYLFFGWTMEQLPAARDLTVLETIVLVLTLAGYVTFTWMKYYIPFLMITFKLSKKQIYKNAFLFAGANMKVNLMISAILIAVYGVLGALVLFTANTAFNYLVLSVVLVLCVSIVPAFRSFLIQYSIFPAIKKLIIDPYYEANPNADKQARLDLNLDVEETAEQTPAAGAEAAPTVEEPIFTDTTPAAEEAPARAVPRQYSEREMRRFNRQVQKHTDDDDDDTI